MKALVSCDSLFLKIQYFSINVASLSAYADLGNDKKQRLLRQFIAEAQKHNGRVPVSYFKPLGSERFLSRGQSALNLTGEACRAAMPEGAAFVNFINPELNLILFKLTKRHVEDRTQSSRS